MGGRRRRRPLLSQQSVSKLWVALTVLDAVDHGRLSLAEPVTVTRADLSVFNQPIAAEVAVAGPAGMTTTVGDLLRRAIVQSDNAADDVLIRRVGGPAAVRAALRARGIDGVRPGPEEHVLQSRIAGVDWRPDYSVARAFEIARSLIDPAVRAARLDAYVADPDDGATPRAITHTLARLQRGELLSPASTGTLLGLMAQATTGPLRLKAGLPLGWTLAHKTGTGQDLGDLSTGYNDVGLVTAPDGRRWAIAVMIAATRRPIPERQALMAGVARALVAAVAQPSAPPPSAR